MVVLAFFLKKLRETRSPKAKDDEGDAEAQELKADGEKADAD